MTRIGLAVPFGGFARNIEQALEIVEAQGFPDAPNQPSFPSARLAPGDVYRQRTIYEFVPGKPDS